MINQITIEVLLPTTPEIAWQAFTEPEAITLWNFATPEWHCPSAEVELVKGGRHIARMEAKDGSMGFDFAGTYEQVEPPHAITLKLDDARISRTTFVSEGEGTRVTTVFEPDTSAPIDMQREGWQAILNNYAAYVREQISK